MTSNNEQLTEKAKKISLRLLIVIALFLASIAVFALIVEEIVLENESDIDQQVFQELALITNAATTEIMITITFFGSSYFLFPAYTFLVVYFLTFGKNKKISLNVAAIGITSTIIQRFLKALFRRHRPPDPLVENVDGFSFPSGHSFSAFTFFGLLIYILWNYKINPVIKWAFTVLFFLFACAIAFSRVYLHVHYLSDVVAGFCLCVTWLTISFWLLSRLSSKYKL